MLQIVPSINLVQKILGPPKPVAGASYRLTTHCVQVEQPEGVLLYHTLTGELLLLEKEEAEQLQNLSGTVPPALADLIPRRFLVPQGTDEMALADQTRAIARLFTAKDNALTEYLIFTTTACNARCFYCFEAGIQRVTMSEETARAAGAYIVEHCGGKPVHLVWFGGEPLVNVKAIDAISSVLRQRGVAFSSRMDSNGYLFDASLAARARTDWGLEQVQITLDGTEEVYNRRKAYVAPQGSPFRRVLENIGPLLDAGIQVGVRLNLDEDNERDLYALIDDLAVRFGGRPGFTIHFRVLIENRGVAPSAYTEEERRSLAEKAVTMHKYLAGKGLLSKGHLPQGPILYYCWSDKLHAATITPEGWLGRCESHIDKGLWGSVFSEDRDEEVLRQWRERRPPEDLCRTCALYPRCGRLKKCVIHPERCSPIERAEMRIWLEQAILGTYEEWKTGDLAQAGTA